MALKLSELDPKEYQFVGDSDSALGSAPKSPLRISDLDPKDVQFIDEVDPKTSPITTITTGIVRGAVPFAAPIAGAGKAAMDAITGTRGPLAGGNLGDLVDDYTDARDSFKNDADAAAKANPKLAFASNIGGGLTNPLFKGADTLPKIMGAGAVQALGDSSADLTKLDPQEFKKAGVDTAIGAGAGALGYGAGKAVGYVAPKAVQGLGWLGKKALTLFGPSDEAISARLAGEAQPSASSYAGMAEKMRGTLKNLQAQIGQADTAAEQTLSTEPSMPKQYVLQALDDALSSIKFHGESIGKAAEGAESTISGLRDKFAKLLPDQISQKDLKGAISILDENTNWADQTAEKTNELLKQIRHNFDQTLKFQNPDYKKAIIPVAIKTRILNNIKKQFNLNNVPGEGLLPTDTTASKLQNALGENKFMTQKNLGLLERHTGDDYIKGIKDYMRAKQFEVPIAPTERSTRRTMAGAGIGSLLGAPSGGLGAMVGGALGAGAGSMADRYGGKVVGTLLDGIVKAGNSQALGKFAPIVTAAAKRGPEALAVTASMLSQNPEFRKVLGLHDEEIPAPKRMLGSQE